MSSSKLDQSLDEIAGSRRANARRQRPAKARVSTGGVTKTTAQKTAKPAKANIPAARPLAATGESKIIVSNLVSIRHVLDTFAIADSKQPSDVNEQQIKVR